MKKTKAEKGITLIALIITIIVLIILALVTLQAVQEHGIIGYAKQAQKVSIEAEEKDQIGLALSEWKIAKAQPNPPTFEDFLKGKFGEDNVTAGGEEGEWLVTFPETGNQYKVKEDGTNEKSKGISISPSSLTLTLKEGETVTEVTDTITATLHGVEGSADEITWASSNEATATIEPKNGATTTVTAVAKGETTITATYGDYTATCHVTVLAIGDFVEYNVAYTDVFNSSNKYTAKNGWRYLGEDPNKPGNSLIISTGILAKLYYYYPPAENAEWFITDKGTDSDDKMKKTLEGFKNLLRGDSDYTFYTGDEEYYGLEASAGLYHNFGDMKFAYGTSGGSNYNKGFFTEITNGGTTYNSSNAAEVKGKDLFITSEAGEGATVRLLTLPEVNKAVGRSDIDSTTTITPDEEKKAAVGLYRLDQLTSVPGIGSFKAYTTGYYYLASPYSNSYYIVCDMDYNGCVSSYDRNTISGIRPVVSLPSSVLHAPTE